MLLWRFLGVLREGERGSEKQLREGFSWGVPEGAQKETNTPIVRRESDHPLLLRRACCTVCHKNTPGLSCTRLRVPPVALHMSRYTCRSWFPGFIAFCRCSTGVALHPLKNFGVAPPPPLCREVSHRNLGLKRCRATRGCRSYSCGCRATLCTKHRKRVLEHCFFWFWMDFLSSKSQQGRKTFRTIFPDRG